MTFRARPRETRPRFNPDRGDRRNALLNLGFTLVVVVSLLLLAVAAGITWYQENASAAATVDGTSITQDELRQQALVDDLRIQLAMRAVHTRRLERTIRDADARQQLNLLEQQAGNVQAIALEHLIDGMIQARLATAEGITVTDDEITAKLQELATRPELRHAWVIEVEPEVDEGKTDPTDAQKAAAKAKADRALARLRDGTAWEQLAKDVSTSATKDQGGDLGFIDDETSGLDSPFVKAVFAAAANAPTEVVEGSDGTYRIGRVTEILPELVDPNYAQKINDSQVSMAAFRSALRADVVRDRLEKVVVDRVKQPGPQRQVLQIFEKPDDGESKTGAIKTKHILYAPNDGENTTDLPADDPAWAKAETEAKAAYDRIKANPALFDQLAREESDDSAAAQGGGKLGYFAPEDSEANGGNLDKDFAAAIFKEGLQPGQLLQPVKSQYGWHVIQIWHRPTDLDWAKTLKTQADGGADFGALARDNGEGPEAEKGGDLGWIAKGQLPELIDARVFGTAVGQVSEPMLIADTDVTAADPGVYLFKVLKEEVRAPEGAQLEQLERTAFGTWYSEQKLKAKITRTADDSGSLTQ